MRSPKALPDPIIDGILCCGELAILSAPYDSFKSSLGLEIAYSVCTGAPFLSYFPVRQTGPVYFFQQEVHPGVFDERVINLRIATAHRSNLWVDYDEFRFDGRSKAELETIIGVKKPLLIVFDPLANFWPTGMRENDNPMMNTTLRPLLNLRETGTSFLMIHGDTKTEAEGQPVRARGASDLLYKPDVRIFMDRLENLGEPVDAVKITMRTRNRKRLAPFTATFTEQLRLQYVPSLSEAPLSQVSPRFSLVTNNSPPEAEVYISRTGRGNGPKPRNR